MESLLDFGSWHFPTLMAELKLQSQLFSDKFVPHFSTGRKFQLKKILQTTW